MNPSFQMAECSEAGSDSGSKHGGRGPEGRHCQGGIGGSSESC